MLRFFLPSWIWVHLSRVHREIFSIRSSIALRSYFSWDYGNIQFGWQRYKMNHISDKIDQIWQWYTNLVYIGQFTIDISPYLFLTLSSHSFFEGYLVVVSLRRFLVVEYHSLGVFFHSKWKRSSWGASSWNYNQSSPKSNYCVVNASLQLVEGDQMFLIQCEFGPNSTN